MREAVASYVYRPPIFPEVQFCMANVDVGAKLTHRCVFSGVCSVLCSNGSLPSLFDHNFGSIGGPLTLSDRLSRIPSSLGRVSQSQKDKKDAYSGKDHPRACGDQHPIGISRHALLGIKIAGSVFLLPASIFILGLGFCRTGDALNKVLEGHKIY